MLGTLYTEAGCSLPCIDPGTAPRAEAEEAERWPVCSELCQTDSSGDTARAGLGTAVGAGWETDRGETPAGQEEGDGERAEVPLRKKITPAIADYNMICSLQLCCECT